MNVKNKTIIGWKEYVSFPEWGVSKLRVKVDTGAKGSALDVSDIKKLRGKRVSFKVMLSRTDRNRRKRVVAHVVKTTKVKSSFGRLQERYVVSTRIKLGKEEREIEISLVERDNMLCRMLLGRTALGKDYIVDPDRRYLLAPKK